MENNKRSKEEIISDIKETLSKLNSLSREIHENYGSMLAFSNTNGYTIGTEISIIDKIKFN